MMTYYRHIYRHAPPAVPLPPELHDRRVEVIVLTIESANVMIHRAWNDERANQRNCPR